MPVVAMLDWSVSVIGLLNSGIRVVTIVIEVESLISEWAVVPLTMLIFAGVKYSWLRILWCRL